MLSVSSSSCLFICQSDFYFSPSLNSLFLSSHPSALLFFVLTSQSWSWRLWRWHHPCSGPTLGFSCSLVTLITSVIILASLQTHTHTKTNPHKTHHMSNSQNNCIVGTHYTTEQTAKTLNINMLHKGLDLRSIHFTIRKVVLLKKYFVSNFPTLKAYLIIF